MLLDPNCLPEYFDPFIGGATDTIKRLTTKTIKAAKPKVKPVRKPETLRPNTAIAMGQTLKTIDNEIQKEYLIHIYLIFELLVSVSFTVAR